MLKTYTIELRVDFDDDHKQKLALTECRRATKQLLTTMTLLADKRKPQVALSTSDMFEGTEVISMFEDNEQENPQ